MLYNTLRQYEYIVGIADAGSLTAAAARLNVSQPSLSVAITRLEQRLESPIFVRGKGAAIQITPYGHRFIESAKELIALAAQIESKQDVARRFVLGCFGDIAPWYLAPAVGRLNIKFPARQVSRKLGAPQLSFGCTNGLTIDFISRSLFPECYEMEVQQ